MSTATMLTPVVLYLALSVPTVGRKPLFRDEMASWIFARLSYGNLLRATRHVDGAFLPYYALVHLTPGLSRHPEAMRAWSLAAGAVTVAVIGLMAAELWSSWYGAAAAVALSLNGAFIGLCQTARPGAIALMFLTIGTYLLVRCHRRGASRALWLGYAVAMGVSACFVLFAALTLAAHLVLALVWWARRNRPALAGFGIAAAGAGVLALPIVVWSAGQGAQLSWITQGTLLDAGGITAYDSGLGNQVATTWTPRTLVLVALVAVAAGVIVVGALRHADVDGAVLALALLLVPPLGLWVVSQIDQPVIIFRYAPSVMLGAALLVAGAARTICRALRALVPSDRSTGSAVWVTAGVAAVAVAAGVGLAQLPLLKTRFTDRSLDDFPRLVKRIEGTVQAGTHVVFVQGLAAGGRDAGIALYADDRPLLNQIEAALPRHVQLLFPSVVTSVHPLRTIPVPVLRGRVVAIGSPAVGLRGNPRIDWAARMAQLGCRLDAPTGRVVSSWTCP